MDKTMQEIATLKNDISQLILQKNEAFIEHFNEEYGADFEENRDFNEFADLYAEDDDGYLDPFDLVMDENDIMHFLQWRYRMFLISYMNSVAECLEKITNGEQHTSKKQLEKDVSDMRKYKKQIKEIQSISDNTIQQINALIELADKYR